MNHEQYLSLKTKTVDSSNVSDIIYTTKHAYRYILNDVEIISKYLSNQNNFTAIVIIFLLTCYKRQFLHHTNMFQCVLAEDLSHLPMEHRGGDVLLQEKGGPVALAQRQSPFRGFPNNKRQAIVSADNQLTSRVHHKSSTVAGG